MSNQNKKKIAVFFGGRSPEHDVSIVTGLQVLQALDQSRFEAFAVYITTDGHWLVGDALHSRDNFLPDRTLKKSLHHVTLDICPDEKGKGRLIAKEGGIFTRGKVVKEFDVAIPSFHGLYGEDGNMQGLFESAGIPYTGMRTMASAVTMNKAVAKQVFQALDIPTLPFALLKRPSEGYMMPANEIEESLKHLSFPVCVKPCHLGSSIGVAKVDSIQEVQECLPAIFKYDSAAIVEPFVENLIEYNVAIAGFDGQTMTSAIERPKATDELLDFKQKYLSGGDNKTGQKNPGQLSEGMLSLTRELNPDLDSDKEDNIRVWGKAIFEALNGTGAPRIDFIGNSKTGEIWMNEINPCPGSFGYFLWEAAADSILFTDLLSAMIDEALQVSKTMQLPSDPVPVDAYLFKRHT